MASSGQRKDQLTDKPVNRLIDFRELAKETSATSTKKSLRRSQRSGGFNPALRDDFDITADEQPACEHEKHRGADRRSVLGDPARGMTTMEKRASYLLSTYNSATVMSQYNNGEVRGKPPSFNFYGASTEGSEPGEVVPEREAVDLGFKKKLSKRSAIQIDVNTPSPLFESSDGLGLVGLTSGGAAVAKDAHAYASTTTPPANDDSLISLDTELDSFLEDLNRDQATSSIRSSSRHIAQRTASNRNTPESSVKSATNGPFSRSVSQPILPSGLRSSHRGPQDDSPFRGTTPPSIGKQGENLAYSLQNLQTSSGIYKEANGGHISSRRDESPNGAASPTRKHKLIVRDHLSVSKARLPQQRSAPLYFTQAERKDIDEKVHSKVYNCTHHQDCTDCKNTEYAYHENIIMSTSMPPEERNKIISNNRSLRNIKNELETLAENGAISDEAFDAIMKNLPAESSFNAGPTRKNPPARASAPEPSMEKLSLDNQPPPAYQKAPTPTLPSRNNYSAPQPEVMRATALYAYSAEGDCNFNVGDEIIVLKLVNDDWWVGKNARTNSEGAFPKTYVQPHNSPPQGNQYPNEKANTGGHQAQGYQGYRQNGPPPPGPSDPYNSAVPPMQMANDPMEGKPGKGGEMGKKFGKKLGNAAIFGAGATIGGNIVNSIF